jgi:hypothetical protein
MLSGSGHAILELEKQRLGPIEISAMLKEMGSAPAQSAIQYQPLLFNAAPFPGNRNSADRNLAVLKP